MSSRGLYRRHTAQLVLQLCSDIRSGALRRRDAKKKYTLSANLIQLWLTQFHRGEFNTEGAEATPSPGTNPGLPHHRVED